MLPRLYGLCLAQVCQLGLASTSPILRRFSEHPNLVRGASINRTLNQDHPMTPDTPDRFLRLDTVLARTGLSRSTLYRKVDAGTFPKQVRIAQRCVGWRESAVTDWMRNPIFYCVSNSAG